MKCYGAVSKDSSFLAGGHTYECFQFYHCEHVCAENFFDLNQRLVSKWGKNGILRS